ncbi:hypothetical protein ACJJTC_007334 [Scirpophaga incertulas]
MEEETVQFKFEETAVKTPFKHRPPEIRCGLKQPKNHGRLTCVGYIVNHYSAPYKCRDTHETNKHVYSKNPYYTRGMCPLDFEWSLIMHPFTPGAAGRRWYSNPWHNFTGSATGGILCKTGYLGIQFAGCH